MPLPGSGGCWSSSDIPWLVDAAHESLRRRHVAFCRGRVQITLAKGQQSLEQGPPSPGDLLSKLALITLHRCCLQVPPSLRFQVDMS